MRNKDDQRPPPAVGTLGVTADTLYSTEIRDQVLTGKLGWLEEYIRREHLDEGSANILRGLLLQHMIRMNDVRMNELAGTHDAVDTHKFYELEKGRLQTGLRLLLSNEQVTRFNALLEAEHFYPSEISSMR